MLRRTSSLTDFSLLEQRTQPGFIVSGHVRLRVWCMIGEGRRACFTGTVIGSSRTHGFAVHPDGLARAV